MSARRRRVTGDVDDVPLTSYSDPRQFGGTFYGQPQGNGKPDNWQIDSDNKENLSNYNYIPIMTSRDRSNEFANAIKTMQGRTMMRTSVKSPTQGKHFQSYSQFMMIAKNIGKNIASTYAKLEKLAICKSRF